MNKRNKEGYSDPTAYKALSKVEQEEAELRNLKSILAQVCGLRGYRLSGQITFVNKKTGHATRL